MGLTKSDSLGEIAVSKVICRASEKGITCAFPRVPSRWDIITEDNGVLKRCQIKYCGVQCNGGSVRLKLFKRGRAYLESEIDILLVFLPQINRVICLTPKQFHNKKEIVIRYKESSRYKNTRAILASDFFW